jgi:hypothetical protein
LHVAVTNQHAKVRLDMMIIPFARRRQFTFHNVLTREPANVQRKQRALNVTDRNVFSQASQNVD